MPSNALKKGILFNIQGMGLGIFGNSWGLIIASSRHWTHDSPVQRDPKGPKSSAIDHNANNAPPLGMAKVRSLEKAHEQCIIIAQNTAGSFWDMLNSWIIPVKQKNKQLRTHYSLIKIAQSQMLSVYIYIRLLYTCVYLYNIYIYIGCSINMSTCWVTVGGNCWGTYTAWIILEWLMIVTSRHRTQDTCFLP